MPLKGTMQLYSWRERGNALEWSGDRWVRPGLKSDTVSVSQALPLYELAGLFLYVILVGLLPDGA
jgi:hypothetical protein